MKKRVLIVFSIAVLIFAVSTISFAQNPIKLVVNGTEMKPEVPPQIINGRTMVPIRFIAELFGTEVNWDQKTQTVSIHMKSERSNGFKSVILQGQVEELEKALAPQIPQEAVQTWAKGVKMGNNSLQKAMLSQEYIKEGIGDYIPWPKAQPPNIWVRDFQITKENKADDGSLEYEVQFNMADSTGSVGSYTSKVFVRQYNQNWYISNIFSDSVAGYLKQKIESYQADRYSKLGIKQLDVSLLSLSIRNKHVFAYYKTHVSHKFEFKNASDWPEQKGRIRYLEVNGKNLSHQQSQKIQGKIDLASTELQKNIETNTRTVDEYFFIRVDLDDMNRVIDQRLLLHTQNPSLKPMDWSHYVQVSGLTLEEELESRGYDEMFRLAE